MAQGTTQSTITITGPSDHSNPSVVTIQDGMLQVSPADILGLMSQILAELQEIRLLLQLR
jgi:hypothetical protein